MNEKKVIRFSSDSPAGVSLLEWWTELEQNRGDRAALRRCASLTEVVFLPIYHRLRMELLCLGRVDDEGLALVVALAARVKSHAGGESVAAQMAAPKVPGGPSKVSDLRFRRLLRMKTRADLFPALSRMVALLGGTVNLLSLANSAYWWNERTRKEWAFDYYSSALEKK